ncbi:protein FAR1-RELATED SEQUENCE 5-like [Silene latifolia]|uniref:protein FAR1-RELATED SEQUENCE 5-like n=1 Tax=Silene latifolia TaxID=37657 RepID=UPI003D77BE90
MAVVSTNTMQLLSINSMQVTESSTIDEQMTVAATIDEEIEVEEGVNQNSPILNSDGERVWIEAKESELIGLTFDTEDDAFRAYCRYSYIKCFGVRKSNERKNQSGVAASKEFCCNKQGNKAKKGSLGKQYTKLSRRIGCIAMVCFKIVDGKYTCSRHVMVHNHEFCHPSEVHHLRCHRKIDASEIKYLVHLRNSGIRLADAFRSLVKEAGGSDVVGFEYGDAATAVKKASKKKFDTTDCNTLINLLKQRAASEEDFYYDFELDEDNSLVRVFYRDRKMRQDYEAFYELLGNDGTYCTNKYDMVCAPFVGINNHTRICLFGIGFMLNECTESFQWLYNTFLASMGGIQPRTIMTDQSRAMKNAIATCFPKSKHRLCVWHLFKNSSAHLVHLKDKLGFNKLFNRIMKRCHTEEELEHCWKRLTVEYNCAQHPWLTSLYELREHWCCAYGKDFFSAGVLSSQRSESTNNSICRRLNKTTTLCDFYEIFGTVLSEWRSQERKDNSLCWEGTSEVAIPCSLLEFGARIYTIGAYKRFQKEFVKGMSYKHNMMPSVDDTLCYFVYTDRSDEFGHVVTFSPSTNYAYCSCKRFEEGGYLCRHILFVYHCNCVDKIPLIYVLKRWTKDAKPKEDIAEGSTQRGTIAGPVWRLDMHRQFHKLIVASADNDITRGIVNNCFEKAKGEIEAILGGIDVSDDEVGDVDIIQNPKKKTKKGEKFTRKRSIKDIQTSRARGKHKAAATRARKKATASTVVERDMSGYGDNNVPSHVGLREIVMGQ